MFSGGVTDLGTFAMFVPPHVSGVVTGPGGAFYRGNVFAGGWSVAGGGADSTNNVENVYVESPAAGLWTVTVRGFNVPQGPQPYAVVVGESMPDTA